jgi:two-component system chemotaxis sensor kinase CheA
VERVDRLLSELGDLVQAHLGLEVSSRGVLDWVPDRMRRTLFRQSLRNVDRRIRSLRQEILRIRMVSLGPLFQRLERTVRETARATGKEARLVTSGDGEELDKRVVEALTEPLVHLVRNAVDHGLEDSATRTALGKRLPGRVLLAAHTEGSHTVLEVSDDGRGIDWARVEEKAVERGLLEPGSRPDAEHLRDLLFRPGFSLRASVTEISGRGVGLDAVRDSITRLGGLLDVRSDGTGTSFRLRIPTTLSVTRSLLVEAAGEPFFVPLSCVSRVDRIPVERIERVDGEEVVLLEDRVVPVVDLGAALGLEPVDRGRERVPAVELGIADRRRILLVDRLAGQREIVVRSLGSVLPAVPGIAGSTELGDGRTVLILDPAALIEPPTAPSVAAGGES